MLYTKFTNSNVLHKLAAGKHFNGYANYIARQYNGATQ
jgi:hypothetical protein